MSPPRPTWACFFAVKRGRLGGGATSLRRGCARHLAVAGPWPGGLPALRPPLSALVTQRTNNRVGQGFHGGFAAFAPAGGMDAAQLATGPALLPRLGAPARQVGCPIIVRAGQSRMSPTRCFLGGVERTRLWPARPDPRPGVLPLVLHGRGAYGEWVHGQAQRLRSLAGPSRLGIRRPLCGAAGPRGRR